MRVTVLGMGNMGRSFAGRALAAGHQVTVWNRTAGRASKLVEKGATESDSAAAAVERADVVLMVLADDAAVLETALGGKGVLSGLAPEAVLANVSTVSPDTVRRLAEAGPDSRVLDTPVMGSPENVANGHCRFLVGGPESAIATVGPLLEDLGVGYTYCGPVGAASVMKIVSNLLLITGVAALAEGIATARHNGIPDGLLATVFAESPVISPTSAIRLDSLLDGDHPGWFTPALARKDLRLAVGLAEESGVSVGIGPATVELLTSVIDSGRDWPDFTAVIEALDA